jgi:hypothetical protein
LVFDGQNPAFVQRLSELTDSCEEAEMSLIDALVAAREHLGLRHDSVKTLIGNNDIGVLVGSNEPSIWEPLCAALNSAADAKKAEAAEKRTGLTRAGHTPGWRGRQKADAEAAKLDVLYAELSDATAKLSRSCAVVGEARAALAGHQASAVAATSASTSGPCMTAFNESLGAHGMSLTRYWMGQFMGDDCRKFADNIAAILAMVRDKINELFGDDKATEFYDRHCGILRQLSIIGHHTRRVAMLSHDQIEELRVACSEYARLFRIAYPDHAVLTPKGHLIESHLVAFAVHYGTIGVFGEDGMEALHPMDTRARVLVRSMRNPVGRHQAMAKYIQIEQQNRKPEQPKRKRIWKRKNELQLALADAAEVEVGAFVGAQALNAAEAVTEAAVDPEGH